MKFGIAFNKLTGETIWQSAAGISGYASPVIFTGDGKRSILIFGEKALYGVDIETGKKLWDYTWKAMITINAADPLVVGNRIFISSIANKGCALLEINKNKPSVVWQNKSFNTHFNSFVYADGYIYGNDGSAVGGPGFFRCLDFSTGQEVWSQKIGHGSLIKLNDDLILLTGKGTLKVITMTPTAYTELASCKLPSGIYWNEPVVAADKLFCRNAKGPLLCLNLAK